MNREILFRGFHADENGADKVYIGGEWIKGEWVYGFYFEEIGVFIKERSSSVSTNTYLVIPETVGQYSGLTDKNGVKIFEGDKIHVFGYLTNPKTKEKIPYSTNGIVKYSNEAASFLYLVDGSMVWSNFRYMRSDGFDYEVIGDIFSNPELLEGIE